MLALAGCGSDSSNESTTPTPESTSDPTVTEDADAGILARVDTMFGPVEILEPEDGELTIVTLGWSDAETVLALGLQPVAVQDWMGFGEDNKGVGPWASDLFGDITPTVIAADYEAIDYELIDSLEPDVILNVRSDNNEAAFQELSKIAPTVYGPDGAPAYATSWRDQTQLIADAIGKSDEGRALIADVEKQLADATSANPAFSELTAVTGTKFGDAYGAYLPGDFRWDLLQEVGFTLNPAVSDLESSGFYAAVSLEQVRAFEADVALFFPIGYTLEELTGDPLLSTLSVVTEDRAVFLAAEDEDMSAFSTASILSIPQAIDNIVPLLAAAAENAG